MRRPPCALNHAIGITGNWQISPTSFFCQFLMTWHGSGRMGNGACGDRRCRPKFTCSPWHGVRWTRLRKGFPNLCHASCLVEI